jgi:hypothetical protein
MTDERVILPDMYLVGFDGGCDIRFFSRSLPVGRKEDYYFKLASDLGPYSPKYHREEILEYQNQGRLTLAEYPQPIPAFEGALAVSIGMEFLASLQITVEMLARRWKFNWFPLQSNADILLAYMTVRESEALGKELGDKGLSLARVLLNNKDYEKASDISMDCMNLGGNTANSQEYDLNLVFAASIWFNPLDLEREVRMKRLFRLIIHREFPNISWEEFHNDFHKLKP